MILRCKRLAIPLSLVGVGGVGSSLASWGFFIFRFGCGTSFWSRSVLTFFPLNLSFIIFFFHSFGSSGHFVGVGSHTEGRLTHREAVHAPCEDIWLGYFWRHELCCGPARLFLQPHRLATGKAKPSAGGAV